MPSFSQSCTTFTQQGCQLLLFGICLILKWEVWGGGGPVIKKKSYWSRSLCNRQHPWQSGLETAITAVHIHTTQHGTSPTTRRKPHITGFQNVIDKPRRSEHFTVLLVLRTCLAKSHKSDKYNYFSRQHIWNIYALFSDFTQRGMVVTVNAGHPIGPIFKGRAVQEEYREKSGMRCGSLRI